MADVRKCGRCKQVKPTLAFGPNRATKSGLKCYCRQCECEVNKERYGSHKAEARARINANRAKPENKARECARAAKYRRSLQGKFKSLSRCAKAKNLPCSLTLEEYTAVVAIGVCHYCEKPLPEVGYGIDRKHSDQGYTKNNCVPCCTTCNSIKGADNITYEEMLKVIALLKSLRKQP